MMSRDRIPLLVIGALGGLAASIGLGMGLGQYATSGINPIYQSSYSTQASARDDRADLDPLFEPTARTD